LKPQSPAERLATQQRDHEKLQRERQLKERQEEGQRQGARLGRGLWGACAAPRTSLPLSRPLQGHPYRVSVDGKCVRESSFSEWRSTR